MRLPKSLRAFGNDRRAYQVSDKIVTRRRATIQTQPLIDQQRQVGADREGWPARPER
jgi:hypothetical protein